MPAYKNQHYVPQFYLRQFTDGDRIALYNFGARAEFTEPVANVCAESYFYGEDADLERKLGDLEGEQAAAIRQLDDARDLRRLSAEHRYYLLTVVLFQRVRTKRMKEDVEGLVNFAFTEFAREHATAGELDPETVDLLESGELRLEGPIHENFLLKALTGVEQLLDLEPALLVNETGAPFLTSDHPVVFENLCFKDKRERNLVGFQSPGLQVFLPVSGSCLLHLYDPGSYTVEWTDATRRRVAVDEPGVVRDLNALQCLNARDNVFYGSTGREAELQSLHDRVEEHRQESLYEGKVHDDPDAVDGEVVETGAAVPSFVPYLPFFRRKKRDGSSLHRSPALVRRVEAKWDALAEEIRAAREED